MPKIPERVEQAIDIIIAATPIVTEGFDHSYRRVHMSPLWVKFNPDYDEYEWAAQDDPNGEWVAYVE